MGDTHHAYIIGASLLGVPRAAEEEVISRLAPLVTFFHLDVTRPPYGAEAGTPELAKRLRRTTRPVDVHWMGPIPAESTIRGFSTAGATFFTVQFEAFSDESALRHCFALIRQTGMGVGVSIAPAHDESHDTRALAIAPFLSEINLLNVLTVVPGRSGQPFLDRRRIEIASAAELIARSDRDIVLQVDGGLDSQTVKPVRPLAKRVRRVYFVSGSYLVNSQFPADAVRLLKQD